MWKSTSVGDHQLIVCGSFLTAAFRVDVPFQIIIFSKVRRSLGLSDLSSSCKIYESLTVKMRECELGNSAFWVTHSQTLINIAKRTKTWIIWTAQNSQRQFVFYHLSRGPLNQLIWNVLVIVTVAVLTICKPPVSHLRDFPFLQMSALVFKLSSDHTVQN